MGNALDPHIKAEIQRIAPDAVAWGWYPELLWEQRFWNIVGGKNMPGLAACMRPGDRITAVTEDYIETANKGARLRFYHPDREFPWKDMQSVNIYPGTPPCDPQNSQPPGGRPERKEKPKLCIL